MSCTGNLEGGYWNASVNNKLQADGVKLQLHGAYEQDHIWKGSLANPMAMHKQESGIDLFTLSMVRIQSLCM